MPDADRISMDEVMRIGETNPQAASLALGMQLMADSHDQTNRIINSLLEIKDARIAELERQVNSLYYDAMRWRRLKWALLAPTGDEVS